MKSEDIIVKRAFQSFKIIDFYRGRVNMSHDLSLKAIIKVGHACKKVWTILIF